MRNANWLEANYWISFTTGTPESLAPSPDGSADISLSDTIGNLLVYFTGSGGGVQNTGIRGPDHQLVAGNPVFDGYFSGTIQQSAIFIPKPGDAERAYLIAWNRIPGVETHRFGLLEVFLGNATDPPQVLSTEYAWFMTGAACKRMVILHDNGVDYWFVGQMEGTNTYHAYLVTSAGLSPTPVISATGTVMPPDFDFGKLIPSSDGTRFVSVSEMLNYANPTMEPSLTEILSFEPGTGMIQHQFTLDAPTRMDGVEFSPSGRFLYVVYWSYPAVELIMHDLYQYDLWTVDPNAAPILMDSYAVAGLSGPSTNILSYAPDGRIYMSHYVPSMGVIGMPDLPFPQCDYAHDGFLATSSPPGLPSFIKRYHDDTGVPMGIKGPDAIAPATALPNPLSGTGELHWPGATGPLALQWMDAQGRVLGNWTSTVQGGRVPLDAEGLAAGHYLLRVQARDKAPVVVRVSVAH